MKSIGALAVTLFTIVAGLAQASDVDWKLYGSLEDSMCFYENSGIVRLPQDHMRVSIKCLLTKDVAAVDVKKDFAGTILNNALEKIHKGYVPPVVVAGDQGFNEMPTVTALEEIANIANVQPKASILYEISCPDRRLRELSTHIQVKGKSTSSDKPRDWRYVLPEGNAARLLKILCHA